MTTPRLPGHADDHARHGSGWGAGARSSPAEEDPPTPLRDGGMEGTDHPRWPGGSSTADTYAPWASTGPAGTGGRGSQPPLGDMPSQWPQTGQGRTQPPATADDGHLLGMRDRGTPPSGSLGSKPNSAQGHAASSGAFERHQMTNPAAHPGSSLPDSEDLDYGGPGGQLDVAPLTSLPAGPFPAQSVHMNFQANMQPVHGANIVTVCGDGPLAGSIRGNPGSARLQAIDHATAANASMGSQLGRNCPAGAAGIAQPAPHQARETG